MNTDTALTRLGKVMAQNQRLRASVAAAAEILVSALEEIDGLKPRHDNPVEARRRLRLVDSDRN